MQSLIEQINTLFQNNQVLSTVAGGSVVVWLVSNIKNIWNRIVNTITTLISFRIVNVYEDNRGGMGGGYITEAQTLFNDYVCSTKTIWERTNNLDLGSGNSLSRDTNGILTGKTNVYNYTYGFSVRIMFGHIVSCHRTIDKGQKITVTTVLRVFFVSKKKFMKQLAGYLEQQLVNQMYNHEDRNYIYVYNGETSNGRKFKRRMDTIFTNHDEHYRLLESIKAFIDNKEKYHKLSYPYSYSALLYGEPGCGKSSTILAVASALNKDITYVNLAKITLEKLLHRLNNADGNIVVFEDIDALTVPFTKNRDENNDNGDGDNGDNDGGDKPSGSLNLFSSLMGVSLSEILNFTDGLLASDGTICLFTTNHIERLDPAFLRSGRMNELIKFTKLDRKTAAKMIKANLDYNIEPMRFKDDEINPADLQAAILNITLGRETFDDLSRKFFRQ